MKKYILFLVVVLSFVATVSFGQEVGIVPNHQPDSLAQGNTGLIEVNVYNLDWFADIPANKLLVTITIANPNIVVIPNTPVTAGVGANPDGWAIVSNSGSTIVMSNTQAITPSQFQSIFFIKTLGVNAGFTMMNASIGFIGAPLANNLSQNDIGATSTTVTPVAPLPVTIASFTGISNDCAATLNWRSATEITLDRYEIEKSTDGKHYTKLASVVPLGSNSSYAFTDMQAQRGANQYRLNMVDKDGHAEYSKTITTAVTCTESRNIAVFPNPAQGSIHIQGLQGNETIRLYDVTGRLLRDMKAQGAIATINTEELTDGVYQLVVSDTSGSGQSFKIAKKR
jgi:hypothetical protein